MWHYMKRMMCPTRKNLDSNSTNFIAGGDLSEINYVEGKGAQFKDENGKAVDAVDYLSLNGFRIARLRIYNQTGPAHHHIDHPDSYIPEGFLNPEDGLKTAARARKAGMKIVLSFHYSDYWTNGDMQDIPLDWIVATQMPFNEAVNKLSSQLYDFTRAFLSRMVAQGSPPDYVSLGNEIQAGMLFPYGEFWNKQNAERTREALALFLKAGASAVNLVVPDAGIILHLDCSGDNYSKYECFFDDIIKRDVKFDVIGCSYYPFWAQKDIPAIKTFFKWVTSKYKKPVMIMETAVNWNPVCADGYSGQLKNNGPVPYGQTPFGQLGYLRELFKMCRAFPPKTILGCLYWDPIMIGIPGVGWIENARNLISNTTLFDFNGKALPAIQAYRENISSS